MPIIEFVGVSDDMSQYREACHKHLNDLDTILSSRNCTIKDKQEEYFKSL